MRKFILTLFILAALSILAVLVAGLEGRLRVTLMGFDVATDLSVAVGALLVAALVLVIVVLAAQYLFHLPARLHARRTMARQRMGTQALAEALMALARGDAEAPAPELIWHVANCRTSLCPCWLPRKPIFYRATPLPPKVNIA